MLRRNLLLGGAGMFAAARAADALDAVEADADGRIARPAEVVAQPVAMLTHPAAAPILLGEAGTVRSRLLNEECDIWLRLPASMADDVPPRQMTAVYVLDAERLFPLAASAAALLECAGVDVCTPALVVGVLGDGGGRRYPPVASDAGPDGRARPDGVRRGGGAESFHHFMVSELRPAIEAKIAPYAAVTRRILIGHRESALLALHVLARHPEAYDGYAALDPDLWWAKGEFAARLISSPPDLRGGPRPALYCAFAGAAASQRRTRFEKNWQARFASEGLAAWRAAGVRVVSETLSAHGPLELVPHALFRTFEELYPSAVRGN